MISIFLNGHLVKIANSFCFKYRELPRTASIFRRMHTKCMFYRRQKEVLPRQNECVCKTSKGWTYGKAGYMFRKDIYK